MNVASSRNVASIRKLRDQPTSTSSTLLGANVVGRLERGDRDTILLHDVNKLCAIRCCVDTFHHDLLNTVVCITQWNLIKLTAEQEWIEFELRHVFRVGNMTEPVLNQLLLQERISAELFLSSQSTDDNDDNDDESFVSKFGRVVAKPVLMNDQFLIKMDNTMILFEGDSIASHYRDYRVGSYYLLINLIPVKDDMYRFIEHQSRSHLLTNDAYVSLSNKCEIPDTNDMPHIHHGTVTRILDSDYGIYELDDQVIACLFHYTNYNLLYPYRIGTRLRITHAHLVQLDLDDTIALKSYWKIPEYQVCLVACLYSDIQVSAFPNHLDSIPWSQPSTHYLFRESTITLPNFPTLLQKLDAHAAIIKKFGQGQDVDTLGMAALGLACWCISCDVQDKKEEEDEEQEEEPLFGSNMRNDLFEHDDKHCTALGKGERLTFYSFPSLKDLINFVLCDEHHLEEKPVGYLAATSGKDMIGVYTKQFLFPSGEMDHMIRVLGMIECDEDGRFYFKDDTYKIPLVVSTTTGDRMPLLGDYYIIKRFRLIQEDLSYTEEKGRNIPLESTYIACDLEDLEHVAAVGSRRQRSIRFTPPLLPRDQIGYFTIDDLSITDIGNLALFSIIEIQPIRVQVQGKCDFSLRSMIRAIAYPIHNHDTSDKEPFETTIVLTSQWLRYTPYLYEGGWFALLGDLDMYTMKRNNDSQHTFDISTFIRKKHANKLSVPPTIIPHENNELLFVSTTATKNKVILSLKSHQRTTSSTRAPAYKERPIYSIRDLQHADMEHGPSLTAIHDRYLEECSHVEGIVTIKTFRDTARPKGPIYKHAESLYQRWQLGTGQPGRTTMFRLRQVDGLDTMDVYMDMSSRPYPQGIIPGSRVIFYNLMRRRRADGSYYAQTSANTRIQVVKMHFDHADYQQFASELIPNRSLFVAWMLNRAHFSSTKIPPSVASQLHSVFRCQCTLEAIHHLDITWMCTGCGTIISHDSCLGVCKNAYRMLLVNAQVELTDGVTSARVFCEGEKQVLQKLLRLPSDTVNVLKEMAIQQGSLTYKSWLDDGGDEQVLDNNKDDDEDDDDDLLQQGKTPNDVKQRHDKTVSLTDLCRRHMSYPYALYGRILTDKKTRIKVKKDTLNSAKLRKHGLTARRVNMETGRPFPTASPPKLRIIATELEPLDSTEVAWNMINSSSSSIESRINDN